MLSGIEIKKRLGTEIRIIPFEEKLLNPNSYNLRLDNELKIYKKGLVLDPKQENKYETIKIPNEGLVLCPGELYIGSTIEYTETYGLIPCISGRSSIGRLGINIHATAGFGDVGFKGTWTLEIFVVRPVLVYPEMEICQIYFEPIEGAYESYKGKYLYQAGPVLSRMYKELNN